ncbi:uncharacterized protein LOC125495243 [Beta vulgaris subsp. vulgaris]|uniref:uncharacterized protein LOC125495243 n=1 Tax=Beta vulgaris subsp. vulgaris TaxID=3555 RepID=UPI0020369F69|nr:uncharacterized protein LOC125495243 [Beta vulgaris subsp. vulgaris]
MAVFFQKVWAAAFFVIIWTVWKERNHRIFRESSSSFEDLHDLILLRLGWWIRGWDVGFPYSPTEIQRNPHCLKGNVDERMARSAISKPSYMPWSPPMHGVLKWNVDASVMELSASSAVGGILRDHQGKFMCLFSSPIPFIEINCAEILAIHRAISISINSEITKQSTLLLESDSANAVMWCNSEYGGPWNMNHQLNFIRHARRIVLNISIIHKGRSSNFVADSLAKQGSHRRSEFIAWM